MPFVIVFVLAVVEYVLLTDKSWKIENGAKPRNPLMYAICAVVMATISLYVSFSNIRSRTVIEAISQLATIGILVYILFKRSCYKLVRLSSQGANNNPQNEGYEKPFLQIWFNGKKIY